MASWLDKILRALRGQPELLSPLADRPWTPAPSPQTNQPPTGGLGGLIQKVLQLGKSAVTPKTANFPGMGWSPEQEAALEKMRTPQPEVAGTATPPPQALPPTAQFPPQQGPGVPIEANLYRTIREITPNVDLQNIMMALSKQESEGGYKLQNVSDIEESYGPFHINVRARRTNPFTSQAFTKEEAMDPNIAARYLLRELETKPVAHALDFWNPGHQPSYSEIIPRNARTMRFHKGPTFAEWWEVLQ